MRRGIEDDLDRFGVSAVIAVGGVGSPAGIAHPGRQHAVVAANQILHAPETTAGKNGAFFAHFASPGSSRCP